MSKFAIMEVRGIPETGFVVAEVTNTYSEEDVLTAIESHLKAEDVLRFTVARLSR